MWRRLMLAGALALFAVLGAGPAEVAASGATIQTGTFTFPVPGAPPCLTFPDVGFAVCGVSGTVDYHLVFTPSGNENSWFKVQDFTGAVFQCNDSTCSSFGADPLMSFSGDSAMVLVHLGPDRPDFILVNHPSAPLPHRVALP